MAKTRTVDTAWLKKYKMEINLVRKLRWLRMAGSNYNDPVRMINAAEMNKLKLI